ncbi:MAG: CPBP family intramembrane metalloprotease [Planctomycetes bacterium]|nr:CPBP family intramembrane metalloprotease [Planctomycetota bacterium]
MTDPTEKLELFEALSTSQAAFAAIVGIAIAIWGTRRLSTWLVPVPAPSPARDLSSAGVVAAIGFVLALFGIAAVASIVGDGGDREPDAPIRRIDLVLPCLANLFAAGVGLRFARARLGADAATFGVTRARPRDLVFGIAVLLALVPAYFGIGAVNVKLIDALGLERHQRLVTSLLTRGRLDPWAALLIVGVVPFCEELLFRGVIQTALASILKARVAIACSAAAFALVHDAQSWLLIVTVGVGLGIVRHRTGSVLAATFFHAAFNAIMLVQIVAQAEGPR